MLPLHPKIRAALIAALATALVSIVAAVAGAYPDNVYVGIVSSLVPVIAGYLKASGDAPA
jgi:hypothetical protein